MMVSKAVWLPEEGSPRDEWAWFLEMEIEPRKRISLIGENPRA